MLQSEFKFLVLLKRVRKTKFVSQFHEFASNVRDFLPQVIFSRMFYYVPLECFGLILTQVPFWKLLHICRVLNISSMNATVLPDLCACTFRLSHRNYVVAWDKWPDQLHAAASLLPSRESNPHLLGECQGYPTIAKLNSLSACSEKFATKFH